MLPGTKEFRCRPAGFTTLVFRFFNLKRRLDSGGWIHQGGQQSSKKPNLQSHLRFPSQFAGDEELRVRPVAEGHCTSEKSLAKG